MKKTDKSKMRRPKAETPVGFQDYFHDYLAQRKSMMNTIAEVFQRYGFDCLETSAIENLDALGKFLPDLDRPNDGVFAWKDDDKWLSLRYDLTAPLARVVAQYRQSLPTPYRRYAMGPVWRNEKPGPGRFRQFYQCDADTVGSNSVGADAEMIVLVADILGSLGLENTDYRIKINNRKVLDGVLEVAGVIDESGLASHTDIRGMTFRAIDKYDRLGLQGVRNLLGKGREDTSGDFTRGAELTPQQIDLIVSFLTMKQSNSQKIIDELRQLVGSTDIGSEGVFELYQIMDLVANNPNLRNRIEIDTSVVRGLDYYTGPVIEVELTFEITDKKGRVRQFGSVAGGGRYDGLIKRFTGQVIPSTGISIGIDRLMSALAAKKQNSPSPNSIGPILVTVMDPHRLADYFNIANSLRQVGFRSEVFLGTTRNIGKQLKYADARNCPLAIIQGEDEKTRGVIQLKDLHKGTEISKTATLEEWRLRDWQAEINEHDLVTTLRTKYPSLIYS